MLVKTDPAVASNGVSTVTIKYALFGASLVAALVAFRPAISELLHRWWSQPEYSHAFFIPAISVWLLWTRRENLSHALGHPTWTGLALVLLAAVFQAIGLFSALFVLPQIGFVLVLLGLVLALGGIPLLRLTFIPIVFLLFSIPVPYFIEAALSWRLQIISSELGTWLIRLAQIPVYLHGNIIDLGTYKLQVVEACSGLRYLYPLMSLGFLATYLYQAPFWQRGVVFISTIPITIFMNSFRICVVGILVNFWGPQNADGFLHMFEGWIIFLACAGLLMAEISLLARLFLRRRFFDVFHAPVFTKQRGLDSASGSKLPLLACFLLICVSGVAAASISSRSEVIVPHKPFTTFPIDFAGWHGHSSSLDVDTVNALGVTDYILNDYTNQAHRDVNFYVAYYASQRTGFSPHSPSVCIPGSGWQITSLSTGTILRGSRSIPINRAIIARGNERQLVYYWYNERGRSIASEWLSKAYLLKDAIFSNRTDGALIRLITTIYPDETEGDADRRLQRFAADVVPRLSSYLPATPKSH